MSKYNQVLRIADDLSNHAEGKCLCRTPEECTAEMARIIIEGARALEAFTPAQKERACGNVWAK
jgi:hypothetical protein